MKIDTVELYKIAKKYFDMKTELVNKQYPPSNRAYDQAAIAEFSKIEAEQIKFNEALERVEMYAKVLGSNPQEAVSEASHDD